MGERVDRMKQVLLLNEHTLSISPRTPGFTGLFSEGLQNLVSIQSELIAVSLSESVKRANPRSFPFLPHASASFELGPRPKLPRRLPIAVMIGNSLGYRS